MGFLADRRGNFSWFRLSILVLVIGAGFLVVGFASLSADQQSRRSPFFPSTPVGATQWGGTEEVGAGHQRTYYRVTGGVVDDVANFYAQEMKKHYGVSDSTGTTLESCQRQPPAGEKTGIPDQQRPANDGKSYDETFVEGESLPFFYQCMFDRSGLNSTQSTLVTIQPGLANEDPNFNTEGDVVVVYEQRWQR